MSDVHTRTVPTSFWTTALRRQTVFIAVFALIGAAAGFGYSSLQSSDFTSSAAILLNPLDGNPYSPVNRADQLSSLQTEATLVSTEPVADIAAEDFDGVPPVEQLPRRIGVDVPTNTQVLEISFTTNTREDAQRGAQAFADAYLAYRQERAGTVLASDIERLERQQASARTELEEVDAELGSSTLTETQRIELEERVSSLSARLASLESQQSALEATDMRPGQLITPAVLPPPAGIQGQVLYGAGGAVAGLLLGLLLAIARARADDRIHQPSDVEYLGVPMLGIAEPRFGNPAGGQASSARHSVSRVPDLPESYRDLRTALVTSAARPPRGLAVLGASPSVTTAPEAAGLGIGLARAGFRVCVIDTLGETTWLLGGRGRLRGLGELLAEEADLARLLVQPEERLIVLPVGRSRANTMDRLLSPRMKRAFGELVAQSDYVLMAGGIATGSDGRALASIAGSVVLVANRHVTTRAKLTESVQAVHRVEADLLGAIVVDAGTRSSAASRFLDLFRRGRHEAEDIEADDDPAWRPIAETSQLPPVRPGGTPPGSATGAGSGTGSGAGQPGKSSAAGPSSRSSTHTSTSQVS